MASAAETDMTVTVLGCETPFPQPGRPCSGYLLQAGGNSIWVDAGSGTLAELQRHVSLADVATIWISHLHPDHWTDLLAAWNAYANDDSLPRPQVLGPLGWADRLDAALGQDGVCGKVFDVVELRDRLEVGVGPVSLQAFQMHHSVQTFGLRAEYDGRVFGYSADTGPCEALGDLARDVQLLVAEAGAAESQEFHCTPEDVAEVALADGVERVVLTHLAPGLASAEALRRFQVRAPGLGEVATIGMRYPS